MSNKINAPSGNIKTLEVKSIVIIIWIILFIIINIFSINNYLNNLKWEKLYKNKDFSEALKYFEKNKDYIWLYNLWNINYRLWQKNQENNLSPLEFWQKSLDFYSLSLKEKYTKNAEFNFNFVKKKLEELKDSKKNYKEKNQKQIWYTKEKPFFKEKKRNSEITTLNTWEDWENNNQELHWDSWKLSQELRQKIELHKERLKQEQRKNIWYFWKVYIKTVNPFDILDEFINNPFFDKNLMNKSDEKKDW